MRQFTLAPEPLVLLAGALVGMGVLVGIVSLIVGAATNRRGVWIGGLVTLLISLAVGGLAGLGLLLAT